jgi:C4-dicarboxylate-specific signal transduction histidine kinase
MHGGAIRALNRPGGGSVFEIELTRRASSAGELDLAVLVVDPTGIIVPAIEPALERRCLDLFAARNVFELRRIYEYERPEVIFFDADAVAHEVAAYLRTLVEASAGAPFLVAVEEEAGGSLPVRADARMTLPALDAEVLALLRTAAARKALSPA